ncbi:MAG: tRNA (guanosine(46)-N7)-methyltransferase TrmB [Cycloclasticus sp. symbiont of Bathymodiolus heckerae]|nr:MAG: tRNA (guanosine(46)-N7)-methyltransferase TrmB [Cycloclasticus sp. symbiont of Bathymodiolus heckerae]
MPDNSNPTFLRRIRSFVKREGRLTHGQETAIKMGWPLFGLDPNTQINPNELFNNDHPITLEIGFGNGDSLANMAASNPNRNYIGIEVHRPGVGHLLRLVLEKKLQNVRVFDTDAIDVLQCAIPDHSLDCVQLFFPDPWHKKRHHKRRIVQTEFLDLIHSKLKTGGNFHAATDWEQYAEHMMETISAHAGFSNSNKTGYADRPEHRPLTKFENRGLKLGHGVWDLIFLAR